MSLPSCNNGDKTIFIDLKHALQETVCHCERAGSH